MANANPATAMANPGTSPMMPASTRPAPRPPRLPSRLPPATAAAACEAAPAPALARDAAELPALPPLFTTAFTLEPSQGKPPGEVCPAEVVHDAADGLIAASLAFAAAFSFALLCPCASSRRGPFTMSVPSSPTLPSSRLILPNSSGISRKIPLGWYACGASKSARLHPCMPRFPTAVYASGEMCGQPRPRIVQNVARQVRPRRPKTRETREGITWAS